MSWIILVIHISMVIESTREEEITGRVCTKEERREPENKSGDHSKLLLRKPANDTEK